MLFTPLTMEQTSQPEGQEGESSAVGGAAQSFESSAFGGAQMAVPVSSVGSGIVTSGSLYISIANAVEEHDFVLEQGPHRTSPTYGPDVFASAEEFRNEMVGDGLFDPAWRSPQYDEAREVAHNAHKDQYRKLTLYQL